MAKKKNASHQKLSDQQKAAVAALRMNQRRLLDHPGVTSVGVGYRIKDGKRTKDVVIQCTVETKLAPEELKREHIPALPTKVPSPDGPDIEVDVVERSFRPNYILPDEPPAAEAEVHDQRRAVCNPMIPGISVSNVNGTAGTIGAFVYDRQTGEPLILSNWHVLHGPAGMLGDPIVQPGPYDDPDIDGNGCGILLRSHLGMAGDCAVARIEGRDWKPEVLELDRTPKRTADPELDDLVVKSGRTTGLTYGVVSRIDVVAKINYGGAVGIQEIGGFEIRPNPDKPPATGEVSQGGDSGSVWMLDTAAENADADVAIGLHFAGETDPDPAAEHAIACKLTSVFDKLGVGFEPAPEHVMSERMLWEEVLLRIARLEERLAQQTASATCACQNADKAAAGAGMGTSPTVAMEAGIPIHGNWCGPGHGGGPTVDALDAACKQHDECYDRRGYFDCDCDRALVAQADRLIASRRLSGRARAAAIAVGAYFRIAPCTRHANVGGINIPIPGGGAVPRIPNIGGAVSDAGRRIRRTFGF